MTLLMLKFVIHEYFVQTLHIISDTIVNNLPRKFYRKYDTYILDTALGVNFRSSFANLFLMRLNLIALNSF